MFWETNTLTLDFWEFMVGDGKLTITLDLYWLNFMTFIDLPMVSGKYMSTLSVLTNHVAYAHSLTDMKITNAWMKINKWLMKRKKKKRLVVTDCFMRNKWSKVISPINFFIVQWHDYPKPSFKFMHIDTLLLIKRCKMTLVFLEVMTQDTNIETYLKPAVQMACGFRAPC